MGLEMVHMRAMAMVTMVMATMMVLTMVMATMMMARLGHLAATPIRIKANEVFLSLVGDG